MIRAPWVRPQPLRPGHCCHRAQHRAAGRGEYRELAIANISISAAAAGRRTRATCTSQPGAIGYFAKSTSTRLKALSIAWSGGMPLLMTSNIATLQTCSVSTSETAGLKT